MKSCKSKILLSIITFFLWSNLSFAQKKYLPIVPEPQKYEITDENFESTDQPIQLKLYYYKTKPVDIAINDLIKTAKRFSNSVLSSEVESKRSIYIGIAGFNAEFNSLLTHNHLNPEEIIGIEGYKLFINSTKIIIVANHQKGLFYGVQSLKQLFRAVNNKSIPGCIITDMPAFKYRAIMDDISRGPIPTLDYMKYQIRRLSEMKVNTIIHYVEHVVKTESHPEFAPEDGSLTIEEWKEIANYALDYNINIIGGFQSFGHFQKILETKKYANLGESGSLISPVNPESYEFLENIYDEMIPAFHSDIFNINCDETFDLGKEDSKQLVDSIGYAEVYYQHIMKLYNIVKEHQKRIIMWGDILLKYPYLLDKLPNDIIIGTWNYDEQKSYDEFIKPFKNSGHEFWVVPGVLNSRRIYPDFEIAFKNIKVFVKEGFEAGASGVLNCFWDDGSTGLFSNDWYGAAYGADKSWNHTSNDSSFDFRYSLGSLAAENTFLISSIKKLNELKYLELTDGMTDKFLFVKLIPELGESNKISFTDLKEAKSIVNEAEELLQKTNLKFYDEDAEYLKFIIELYKILIDERYDLLDAVKLYSEAESILSTDPFTARSKIITSLKLISNIISNQQYLKKQFEILWLKENHTYALDWITDKYDAKINSFNDVKRLLFVSLKRLDSSKPILAIKDVRLAISLLPGKYFTEWLMVDPLPNKDTKTLSNIDYLVEMGGEVLANPKVTQEFYFDDEKYRWRRVISENQDVVDINEIIGSKYQEGVIYAFATIFTEKTQKIEALVGFSNGIEIFINGNKVFTAESLNLLTDQQKFMLPLSKGINNLLLKITKLHDDWGFTFRIPDVKVRNKKNRYRLFE